MAWEFNDIADVVKKGTQTMISSKPSLNVRCRFHYASSRQLLTSYYLTRNCSVTLQWYWMLWWLAACCLLFILFLHFSGPCWVHLVQVNLSGSSSSLTPRYMLVVFHVSNLNFVDSSIYGVLWVFFSIKSYSLICFKFADYWFLHILYFGAILFQMWYMLSAFWAFSQQ